MDKTAVVSDVADHVNADRRHVEILNQRGSPAARFTRVPVTG
jgi:hypothetical protein